MYNAMAKTSDVSLSCSNISLFEGMCDSSVGVNLMSRNFSCSSKERVWVCSLLGCLRLLGFKIDITFACL